MDASTPERTWLRSVLARAVLLGAAVGATGLIGSTRVLSDAGGGSRGATVVIATFILALGTGMWAGAPAASEPDFPLRQRWLSAAAVVAIAGAFVTFSTLFAQLYPGPWWRVAGLIVVVAAPIYMLGMVGPVLLAWAERWADREEEIESEWSALGAVVAGAFGGAAGAALVSGLLLLPEWREGSILMVAAALPLAGFLFGDPSRTEPRETELFETTTALNTIRVTEVAFPGERQPERRLYLNGEEESGELVRSGAPTLPYIAAAEDWLSRLSKPGARYLFLGGGAYTLPRRIAERDPRAPITVVELDPGVTRVAHQFFGLEDRHRITSIYGDARAFLDLDDPMTFDRIYVDVYRGDEALPYSLITREAAAALAGRLAPGGVVAINLIGTVVGGESLRAWSVARTFADVFPTIALYVHLGRDYPERQNLLLTASLEPDRAFPPAAGYFDSWPRDEWPVTSGTTIFRDLAAPAASSASRPRESRAASSRAAGFPPSPQ